MKYISILSVLCGMFVTTLEAQNSPEKKSLENLKAQATKLSQAFMNNDYKTFIKYTNPKIISLMGGQEKMEDALRKSNTQDHDLFLKGIYLEDLQITIPWGASFYEIEKYGNPKILPEKKKVTIVRWDSVKILNGTNINLRFIKRKCALCKDSAKIFSVYGSIKNSDVDKLKKYFEDYTHIPGKMISGKNQTNYYWTFDDCNIQLGYFKSRWASYGGYLNIQKIKK